MNSGIINLCATLSSSSPQKDKHPLFTFTSKLHLPAFRLTAGSLQAFPRLYQRSFIAHYDIADFPCPPSTEINAIISYFYVLLKVPSLHYNYVQLLPTTKYTSLRLRLWTSTEKESIHSTTKTPPPLFDFDFKLRLPSNH